MTDLPTFETLTPEQRLTTLQEIVPVLTERLSKVVIATIGPRAPSLQDVTILSCISSLGLFEAAVEVYEDFTKVRLPAAVRGDLSRKLRGLARKLEVD